MTPENPTPEPSKASPADGTEKKRPVFNIDADPANANWLRIVAKRKEYAKATDPTERARILADIARLEGKPVPNTPAPDDVAPGGGRADDRRATAVHPGRVVGRNGLVMAAAEDAKVIGKVGGDRPGDRSALMMIDPDGGDRWLITVQTRRELNEETGELGPWTADKPSGLIPGAQWMMRNGGYVTDITPADEEKASAAIESLRKNPPTADDYREMDKRWPPLGSRHRRKAE